MLINDHLSVDTLLLSIESNVNKITDFRNNLYQLLSFDDFKQYRGDLSQFLFDIEADIKNTVESLKEIQQNNRQFYDSFAELENRYHDISKKAYAYENENKGMQLKLIDANKQIEYLSNMNMNQENYINELLDKLSGKERDYYGCQLTKRNDITNSLNNSRLNCECNPYSGNRLNFNYNSDNNSNAPMSSMRSNPQINNNKTIPDIKPEIINEHKEEEEVHEEIPVQEEEKSIPQEEINVLYSKQPTTLQSIESQNVTPPMIVKEDESTINQKNKIDRIQNIVLKGFGNEQTLKILKDKYGNNIEDKIITEDVSDDFLNEIEDLIEKSNQMTIENKSIDQVQNIPEKESEVIPTGHFNQKVTNGTSTNRSNSIKVKEESNAYSTLKNYFILNLKRDLMMSKGK